MAAGRSGQGVYGFNRAARSRQPRGFEDLVDLGEEALLEHASKTDIQQVLELFRDYLRGVTPDRREAPVLAAARHVLRNGCASGQPLLADTSRKTVLKCTVPKLLELCHPECEGSYEAVLSTYHDNGLFANVLQVLDALLLARPGVPVLVDWRRRGGEGHFQYGPVGFDLFEHLFENRTRCHSVAQEPRGAPPKATSDQPKRINAVFMNLLRGFVWTIPEDDLRAMRRAYAKAAEALCPSPLVQRRVEEVCGQWPPGARVVGVHKRLGTPEVAACQLSQRAPPATEFAEAARAILAGTPPGVPQVVFLATDDSLAAEVFRAAFPSDQQIQLCCREGVKRSEGGVRPDGVDNEVHRRPCEEVDAEDALVDALCLRRCSDLVCLDSNLSIFVALTNPKIELHALNSVLPSNWEELAARPSEPVYGAYRVVFSPAVCVSELPTAAGELIDSRRYGEVVETTGRLWDGWVEIADGGWIKLEGDPLKGGGWTLASAGGGMQFLRRGMGKLLEPVGPANVLPEAKESAPTSSTPAAPRPSKPTPPARATARSGGHYSTWTGACTAHSTGRPG